MKPENNVTGTTVSQQEGDVQKNQVVGYVHNVSPVKNEKFFDFQIQTKEKIMRSVFFASRTQVFFRLQ